MSGGGGVKYLPVLTRGYSINPCSENQGYLSDYCCCEHVGLGGFDAGRKDEGNKMGVWVWSISLRIACHDTAIFYLFGACWFGWVRKLILYHKN